MSKLVPPGLALVLVVCLTSCTKEPDPNNFVDTLTGPVSSFQIPFASYALTPSGLMRTDSASGTENGIERPIARTASGRYLSRDFVFEVDVTIPVHTNDIAFVGLGAGRGNQAFNNEPTSAALFRIHNLPKVPHHGVIVGLALPKTQRGLPATEYFSKADTVATYTPGQPMRVRIEHRGGAITLSVPSVANSARVFDRASYADLFDAEHSYLFVADGANGTTFSNAQVWTP